MLYKTNRTDLFLLLLLACINVVYAKLFANFDLPPFEDAAMIMRYAEHLANGQGIVWNIGELPLDGATDFFVVVVVGAMVKIGLTPEVAIRFLTIFSHFASITFIYFVNRKYNEFSRFWAFVFALYFSLNTGIYYIASYFATPFFALFFLLVAHLGNRILLSMEVREVAKMSIFFAIIGILTGMIRPEGIIWVGYVWLIVLFFTREKEKRLLIFRNSLPILLGLGSTYFFWRWHYFGYPLPNPFYRKGGGNLYWESALFSFYLSGMFILPTIPAWIWGIWQEKTRKIVLFTAMPALLFAGTFLFLSNEMNFCGRFQYPLLGIILIAPFWKYIDFFHVGVCCGKPLRKPILVLIGLYLLLACVLFPIYRYKDKAIYENDGKYEAARFLQKFAEKNYTLATTEAGLLPYYSQWRSIDVWGLNDAWITHNKVVTSAYLDKYKPDVIMIHDLILPEQQGIYSAMMDTLNLYIQSRPYLLALRANPYQQEKDSSHHLYYVKADCKDKDRLITGLRNLHYADWQKAW